MKKLIGVVVVALARSAMRSTDTHREGRRGRDQDWTKRGSKKVNDIRSSCIATAGFGASMAAGMAGGVQRTGSFNVIVATNRGLIASLAYDAKRLYKTLAPESITENLRTPAVFVTVTPLDPSRSSSTITVAAPIEHVVVKSKVNKDAVIQPENIEKESVEWSNLVGGKVEANKATARFTIDSFKELPLGDFDIVVITTAGERSCKVGEKDRAMLFPKK